MIVYHTKSTMKTYKKLIGVALAFSMTLSSMIAFADAKFSDVEAGSAVETAVVTLSEKGIISGYPDGTFKPDGAITRAEFAAVITRFKGIADSAPADAVTGFADLDADAGTAWAKPYVKAAVDAGIINGFNDGTFRAGESVIYEQAIKMIVCALGFQSLADEELAKIENATWSAGYIAVANNKGITDGAEVADVTAPATRGIVAILTGNALEGEEETPAVDYSMTAADVEAKRAQINEKKSLKVLSLGSSYIDDSFKHLAAIAAADGIEAYTVNMYKGGATIKQQWQRMKGEEVYSARKEYLPNSTTNKTENVSFDDGLATNGGGWDYITMHQRSLYAPFFEKWYTAETPYITDVANYVREKSPGTEVLFFENWATYSDGAAESYPTIVEGIEKEKHFETVFSKNRENYLKAAEIIGNPNRVIPAGEAVFLAVTKYGIPEYIDDANPDNASFKSQGKSMFRDKESHMTYDYGRVLSALTWYEYLTGNDVRQNTYKHENISEADMVILREIAHEACSLPQYNPAN